MDASIQKGIGALSIPQGVLGATGRPVDVRKALVDGFLQPDVSLAEAAAAAQGVSVSGFVSDWVTLSGGVDATGEDDVVDLGVTAALAEEAFWQAVDAMGNKASYEAYLRR